MRAMFYAMMKRRQDAERVATCRYAAISLMFVTPPILLCARVRHYFAFLGERWRRYSAPRQQLYACCACSIVDTSCRCHYAAVTPLVCRSSRCRHERCRHIVALPPCYAMSYASSLFRQIIVYLIRRCLLLIFLRQEPPACVATAIIYDDATQHACRRCAAYISVIIRHERQISVYYAAFAEHATIQASKRQRGMSYAYAMGVAATYERQRVTPLHIFMLLLCLLNGRHEKELRLNNITAPADV